jgi:hypothetical protein
MMRPAGISIRPPRSCIWSTASIPASPSSWSTASNLADPFPGVGVNDHTVLGPRGADQRLPGSAVTVFQNGVFLQEERDYSFRYDPISNTMHLIPISGIWRDDAVYEID